MFDHLVFYDGSCGFCDRIVMCLYQADQEGKFGFAPLEGKTAEKELKELTPEQKSADSMILIENFHQDNQRVLIYGKAALRTAWLMGGAWRFLGIFYYLIPAFITDFFYRLVAKNRHLFISQKECVIPPKDDRDRFLD